MTNVVDIIVGFPYPKWREGDPELAQILMQTATVRKQVYEANGKDPDTDPVRDLINQYIAIVYMQRVASGEITEGVDSSVDDAKRKELAHDLETRVYPHLERWVHMFKETVSDQGNWTILVDDDEEERPKMDPNILNVKPGAGDENRKR